MLRASPRLLVAGTMMPFDIRRFFAARIGGHNGALGLAYRDHGPDWVELELPWRAELVDDVREGTMASGAVLATMDVAASAAVWGRAGVFVAHATLDLRIDHLRSAKPGRSLIGRCECYRLESQVAFVRGEAHDGDPADPVVHMTGTFMAMDRYR